ncbi:response regulator transcription factor [Actinoplanes sp. NPDC024001]|uniref:response regulator transcription factor n=1 Tax=Actinoplanes sp. NPDC024001 TaxID=3154598 RepID=UPI0033DA2F44
MSIRILLADDQPMIRAGIAMLLSAQEGMEVVGEAGDGLQAVAMARDLEPDVVVMDLQMPQLDGVAATRQLTADDFAAERAHTVKVLVLTTFSDETEVFAALRAGASGYLVKDGAPTELATAIREVCAGNAYLHPAVTRGVIADIAGRLGAAAPVPGLLERLTPREREILSLMALGLPNREIAARLFLAEATVKTHVCRVIMKLEVEDRTQAVVLAYQNRLVQPRP